jgi:NAD(P)-dependent dehydrogenase (short-subunit alcohol dehydrogenase family)
MLGEAGAIVYCTGRSRRGRPWLEGPYAGRPESIEETAELVSAAGGLGIAVPVDHEREDEVAGLFARVQRERGQLDVLVNVLGGHAVESWAPFWELSCAQGRAFFESWVWKHVLTARHGASLMVARGSGLIVEVTEGDHLGYNPNLYWDVVKTVLARTVYVMAEELAVHGVAALALTPGYLRSEFALDRFGVTESNWRDAVVQDANFLHSETPCFVGRAVVALARDPQLMRRTGGLYSSWGLAGEYGFTDIDGSRPELGRHLGERAAYPYGKPRITRQWQITAATND